MSSKINTLVLAILDRDAVYDALFSHCTPGTIHRVSRTCSAARRAVLDYNARAYDINTHLRRFVTNPDFFRTMQELYRFIVSGSFALQFMDRTIYPESDMDLYVKAVALAKWIMQEGGRGYTFAPRGDQPESFEEVWEASRRVDDNEVYPTRGSAVFSFVSSDEERKKIQVITTNGSALTTVLNFHSTVVMNAITHCGAFSLFPRATFEDQRNVICVSDPEAPRQRIALEKYVGRGWKSERYVDESEDEDPRAPYKFGTRWVGDRHTWIIPLHRSYATARYDARMARAYARSDSLTTNGFSFIRTKALAHPNADPDSEEAKIKIKVVAIAYHSLEERELFGYYTMPVEWSYKWKVMIKWLRHIRWTLLALRGNLAVAQTASASPQGLDSVLRYFNRVCREECTCTFHGVKAGVHLKRRWTPCPAYKTITNRLAEWMSNPLLMIENPDISVRSSLSSYLEIGGKPRK